MGYGGTKEEMQRLLDDASKISGIKYDISSFADIIDAIHVMQEEMGIAGATAAEAATTIEGSSNAMKAAWKNLVTGVANENADFDGLVNDFANSIGTYAENILPRIEIALNGIGTMVEKLLPPIMAKLPNFIVNVVPKLANAAVKGLKSILGSIKKNSKEIAKTFKEVVFVALDGLLTLVPDIIDIGTELFVSLVEAIPEVIPKIVSEIPKIVDAMARGIKASGGALIGALKDVLDPNTWSKFKIDDKIEELFADIVPFSEVLKEAGTNLVDLSTVLSEKGRTIGEIGDEIREAEESITEIIKKEYEEQDGYRQKDIESIIAYNDKIRGLQTEKLDVYRTSILAELSRIQLEEGDITRENYAQTLNNMSELLSQANEVADQAYTEELVRIQNWYNSIKEKNDEVEAEYKRRKESAKANYDSELDQNEEYYQQALAGMQDYLDEMSGLDLFGVMVDSSNATEYADEITQVYREAIGTAFKKSGDAFADSAGMIGSTAARFKEMIAPDTEALSTLVDSQIANLKQLDLEAYNSFFHVLTMVKSVNGELTEENELMANEILAIFENLPPELEYVGRQALLNVVSGLEDQIPGLEKTVFMSSDEIVDVLRDYLSVEEGEEIGGNVCAGLINSINNKKGVVVKKFVSMAEDIVKSFKDKLQIRSPSRVFKKLGIQTMDGYGIGINEGLKEVKADMKKSLVFDDVMANMSSSTRIAGESYARSNSNYGQQNVNVTVTVDENVNAMGLARELLPYLKIAAQEVYA